jgi:hypothetical protein
MKKECPNRDFNKIKKILKIGMILPLEHPVNPVKIVVQTREDCGSGPYNDEECKYQEIKQF